MPGSLGGSASRDRSSTIPAAGSCPRRFAPSSTMIRPSRARCSSLCSAIHAAAFTATMKSRGYANRVRPPINGIGLLEAGAVARQKFAALVVAKPLQNGCKVEPAGTSRRCCVVRRADERRWSSRYRSPGQRQA